MKIETSTPRQDGFHIPAEFELHEGCWMLWPDKGETFRAGGVYAQKVFCDVAKVISRYEKVTVCVNHRQYNNALYYFQYEENIRVIEMSSDDAWMRDVGPTFVVDSQNRIRGIDWAFNAYGGLTDGLYFPWEKDNMVARKVCSILDVPMYSLPHFVMEGGSFLTDGEGTLVVAKECLLSEGRNPNLSKSEIEQILHEYLGVEKILWLERGMILDETNGHVDNLLCFNHPGEVLLSWTDDKANPQYDIVRSCLETLESETDAKGRRLLIRKMPLPPDVRMTEEEAAGLQYEPLCFRRKAGDCFAASYVNIYIANGCVVYPTFNAPQDETARNILAEAFPRRDIIGIPARELFLGGGGIHGITLQQPKEFA